ncbi:MAG: sulfur reduction protein DsrE [Methanomicrobiales archaeon]|nr:sulfur reduction protein DsrE [Methanomicrobiales archaeon]
MATILYVQSSGTDTPERLYAPFILGMTAAAMDVGAAIFFLIRGVEVMKKGEAEKIRIGAFPPLAEIIAQAQTAGVAFYVCEQSAALLGISTGDFMPGAIVAGAGTLNDLALDADAVISL